MAADPRSVPEIAEAAALFEAWERSVNDVDAAKRFTEAVELLEDYLSGEPESPHRAFAQNLKRAIREDCSSGSRPWTGAISASGSNTPPPRSPP